ncbi:hypothetical protein HYH02_004211 [Chlamydomonas schloesseri]|uniref:Uncharacterized protein n=1 Tax=Chlamydomonas schloesseri TaxID=2026947 RepID=A0A836B8T7_9CHLO|nr:hypothetical protein HYH02_004211 [Chlamydomonas schloesseri]|eukprot:KAG2450938.1 hypothetical protein HYH02_004211 [Chlamydomonas schloesseri]
MHMRPLLHVGLRHDLTVELALGPQPDEAAPHDTIKTGWSKGADEHEEAPTAHLQQQTEQATQEDEQMSIGAGRNPTGAHCQQQRLTGHHQKQVGRVRPQNRRQREASSTCTGHGDTASCGKLWQETSEEARGKRHCRRSSPAAAADGAADVQVAPSLVVHSRRDQVAAAEQHHRDGEDELQEQEAGHAAAVKQFPAAPTQAATARAAAGSRQQSQPPRPSPHSPPPRPPRAAPHSPRQQQPPELQALWRVMLQVPAAQMRAARALNRRQAALAAAVGAPVAAVTSDGPALSSFRSSLREVVALLLRARVVTSLPTTPLSCGGGGTSGSHHIGSGSGGSTTDSSGSGSGGSGTSSGDGSSGVGACCCCCALQQTAGGKAAVPAVPCCCWRSAAHYLHAASVAVADCYVVLADAAEKDAEWLEQEQAQQLQAAEEGGLGVGQGGEGQDGCQEGQAAAAGQQVDRYGEGKDWCEGQEGGEGGQERRLAGSHPDGAVAMLSRQLVLTGAPVLAAAGVVAASVRLTPSAGSLSHCLGFRPVAHVQSRIKRVSFSICSDGYAASVLMIRVQRGVTGSAAGGASEERGPVSASGSSGRAAGASPGRAGRGGGSVYRDLELGVQLRRQSTIGIDPACGGPITAGRLPTDGLAWHVSDAVQELVMREALQLERAVLPELVRVVKANEQQGWPQDDEGMLLLMAHCAEQGHAFRYS